MPNPVSEHLSAHSLVCLSVSAFIFAWQPASMKCASFQVSANDARGKSTIAPAMRNILLMVMVEPPPGCRSEEHMLILEVKRIQYRRWGHTEGWGAEGPVSGESNEDSFD